MGNTLFFDSPISKKWQQRLDEQIASCEIIQESMENVEAMAVFSLYLKRALQYGLRHYTKPEDLQKQLEIANVLIEDIQRLTKDNSLEEWLLQNSNRLKVIAPKPADKGLLNDMYPKTSLAMNTLFTGNQHEPQVYRELKREIATADSVDMLVSFIRHSGLRLIYDDLVELTKTKKLRVMTTSYMGATDPKAILLLAQLPNTEVRISYDTQRTRLHAKAYYFERSTGFSTAYIGSSNLSKAALSEGTEWNMKVSEYSSPEIIAKFKITFETYWHMSEFEPFHADSKDDCEKLYQALSQERTAANPLQFHFDLRPFAYQQDILDQLEIERRVYGSTKNLVVAATGTGKTMVAAFDYLRLLKENPGLTLLFLAHRREILEQSWLTYRAVLKNNDFGELWVGGEVPRRNTHIFASIQTMNASEKYLTFSKTHFDVIVLDETHHGSADSYQRMLAYFEPKILLGLTATPERMDGKNILDDFNGRISYEIRLHQAIEQNLLCPFHYFGVTDNTDISQVKWQSGRYATNELSVTYMTDHQRDRNIIASVEKYVGELRSVYGLGFCVDIAHARYMSNLFKKVGIPSESLDANTPGDVRSTVQHRLKNGQIRFIFVVDLYNEGVDIPFINTVLFLRPTESATVFVQQLGRGLRLYEGKEVLTVLDFIGQAHQKYDYRMKFQKLVGQTKRSVRDEVENDFPSVPRNCFIQLEKIAQKYVLDNLKQGQTNLRRLLQMLSDFQTSAALPLTLRNFLQFYDIEPRELYKAACLFELVNKTDALSDKTPLLKNVNLSGVFYKIAQIDDRLLLEFLIQYIQKPEPFHLLRKNEQKMMMMFYYTIFDTEPKLALHEVFYQLNQTVPEMMDELLELLRYCYAHVNHLPIPVQLEGIPLELHAQYSSAQVLASCGVNTVEKLMPFREGAKFVKRKSLAPLTAGIKHVFEENLDVFFITLNKSEKHYSETTLYEDYAIDQDHFHWQSQSRITELSPTGQRYIHQRTNGTKVLLFVREDRQDENNKTAVYTCLGLADYMNHSGSAPISIIYHLHEKMPPRLLRASNRFVDIG